MLNLSKCLCGVGTKMSPNFTIISKVIYYHVQLFFSLRNKTDYHVAEVVIEIQTTIHHSSTIHPQNFNIIKFKCKLNMIVVTIKFVL